MDRKEIESILLEKAKEIWDLYQNYNPDGTYMDVSYINGRIMINNRYYGDDKERPVDVYYNKELENV